MLDWNQRDFLSALNSIQQLSISGLKSTTFYFWYLKTFTFSIMQFYFLNISKKKNVLMYRLRDNIEELRCSLQPKESALEALQQTLLEKEQVLVRHAYMFAWLLMLKARLWKPVYLHYVQMLEDMRGMLQSAEEKKQASMTELSAKHQKVICFRCLDYKFFFNTKIGWFSLCYYFVQSVS